MVVSGMFRQLAFVISIDHLISLVGIGVFARWLIVTSLGRRALVRSRPRRNGMPPYLPFIPLLFWFFGIFVLQSLVRTFHPIEGQAGIFQDRAMFGLGSVLVIVLVLILARICFARGIKGFGLRFKTIPRDVGAAFATLLAIWPLVAAAIIATTAIGTMISQWFGSGPFEMPQHETLTEMQESPSVALHILLTVLAVGIVPFIEEMLFRGLIQTTIRTYFGRVWPSIAITAFLFASVHGNPEHWPALFVLAVGMGYAYEVSGSLFRPIFMHAMFNGFIILSTMMAPS